MSVQYIDQDSTRRKELTSRMRSGDLTVSNKDIRDAFAIDPHYNVNDIPLESLDPSHPSLFAEDTLWEHFARLRKEDPVHYHEESISGPLLVGDQVRRHHAGGQEPRHFSLPSSVWAVSH